jgi:predicted TIM-barrel fold metal-dependent hydrolase
MPNYRVISGDDHVVEPPDLWDTRGEAKYKGRLPHVYRLESLPPSKEHPEGIAGGDWWITDGNKHMGAFIGAQTGLRHETPDQMSNVSTYDEVRLGGYIPEEHIKDMDIDGIDMSIVYPSIGLSLYGIPDSDLVTSIFRTYNDWVSEFCKTFPKRHAAIAMINIDDVSVGVKELERCAKMGFAGAMITVEPQEMTYDNPEYNPLWAAAQDNKMPLSLHLVTSRPRPHMEAANFDTISPTYMVNVDHWVRNCLSDMIFSAVFDRYPNLWVGAQEMELSWVPHFLDRMDYNYTQRSVGRTKFERFKTGVLPSDYFHSNVFLGFQEDSLGIRDRHIIGVDQLLWGSDYPHQESTFPKSREIIDEILSDCTDEEKTKIVGGNAATVYGLT